MNRNIGIISTGMYVPSKILTNKDLEKIIDTSDEWIFKKTGIKQRRISDLTESSSDLALYAATNALNNANMKAKDIDLIVLNTSSPDFIQPPTACVLQGKLGAVNATAFDVNAVCAGFIFGISVAFDMMRNNNKYKNVLVVGAESYSKILDWKDRNTCVFFGDGAGAVILSDVEYGGIKGYELKNDGTKAMVIKMLGGGSKFPTTEETLHKNYHKFDMQGKQVWDFAVNKCPEIILEVLKNNNLAIDDLDWIIPHQANINIIEESFRKINITMDKTYTTIKEYANTAGASIPLTLAKMNNKSKLKKNDKICLVGFGGGLSYGAVLIEWSC